MGENMKSALLGLLCLVSRAVSAEVSCKFTTEMVNSGKARCELKEDKVKAVYRQECSNVPCYPDSSENLCTSCDDVFDHYEKIGEYRLKVNIVAKEEVKTPATITLTYGKSHENILSSSIDKVENMLMGLDFSQLTSRTTQVEEIDIETITGDLILNQADVNPYYEVMQNSFTALTYNKVTNDLLMPVRDNTDLKKVFFELTFLKKSGMNRYYYHQNRLNSKHIDYLENHTGEKFARINLQKFFSPSRGSQQQTSPSRIPEKNSEVTLHVNNGLPAMINPIEPEKYIKNKELKVLIKRKN